MDYRRHLNHITRKYDNYITHIIFWVHSEIFKWMVFTKLLRMLRQLSKQWEMNLRWGCSIRFLNGRRLSRNSTVTWVIKLKILLEYNGILSVVGVTTSLSDTFVKIIPFDIIISCTWNTIKIIIYKS